MSINAGVNLPTSAVTVFPSSQRNTNSSRLMTEQRIVGLVNNLLDVDGFIIGVGGTTDTVEFNILGYYFSCNLSSIKSSMTDGDSIWAHIVVSGSSPYKELQGQDVNSNYEGVLIHSYENDGRPSGFGRRGLIVNGNNYYLKLGQLSGTTISLANPPKINYVSIDCGTIS